MALPGAEQFIFYSRRELIMAESIREFSAEVTSEVLQNQLEKYKQLALELGATDAKIVSTDLVVIDERVLARCVSPMCPYYMTNLNCPPHSFTPEETRRLVECYDQGIFIVLQVPAEEHANKDYDDSKKHRIPGSIKMYKIVAEVQNAAYYDG
jgi:predicted metal-binding protein